MAPPRRGWAARTTEEARASGGPHPEGRNEMEQLGEAGLAARRGGPSREPRPDPPRGRPEKSAPPRQRPPLVSGRSPRIALRDAETGKASWREQVCPYGYISVSPPS